MLPAFVWELCGLAALIRDQGAGVAGSGAGAMVQWFATLGKAAQDAPELDALLYVLPLIVLVSALTARWRGSLRLHLPPARTCSSLWYSTYPSFPAQPSSTHRTARRYIPPPPPSPPSTAWRPSSVRPRLRCWRAPPSPSPQTPPLLLRTHTAALLLPALLAAYTPFSIAQAAYARLGPKPPFLPRHPFTARASHSPPSGPPSRLYLPHSSSGRSSPAPPH